MSSEFQYLPFYILKNEAKKRNIKGYSKMDREQLVLSLSLAQEQERLAESISRIAKMEEALRIDRSIRENQANSDNDSDENESDNSKGSFSVEKYSDEIEKIFQNIHGDDNITINTVSLAQTGLCSCGEGSRFEGTCTINDRNYGFDCTGRCMSPGMYDDDFNYYSVGSD